MKTYKRSHAYKYGGRVINWRTLLLSITILYCVVLGSHVNDDNTYVSDDTLFMQPVVVAPEPSVEDKIKEYFPRNWKTMIAIAHAESHMDMDAVGYNCYYVGDKVYTHKVKGAVSKSCAPKDRSKAWSVDCFVLQKNYPGRTTCPEGVTLDMHLKEAADLSRTQGLHAWVTYQVGTYKKYLIHENI